MADNKTRKTGKSVSQFLRSVENDRRRRDCETVMELMREVTGERAAMWGPSIIGFGTYHYKYASGREGDMPLTGVSPRRRSLSIYIMDGFERHRELMQELGKHKTGKSCVYINRLDDIDVDVLRQLVRSSVTGMRSKYA